MPGSAAWADDYTAERLRTFVRDFLMVHMQDGDAGGDDDDVRWRTHLMKQQWKLEQAQSRLEDLLLERTGHIQEAIDSLAIRGGLPTGGWQHSQPGKPHAHPAVMSQGGRMASVPQGECGSRAATCVQAAAVCSAHRPTHVEAPASPLLPPSRGGRILAPAGGVRAYHTAQEP